MILVQKGNATRMLEDIKTLSSFGNRFAGSEAEDKAADFVKKAFQQSGLEVIEEGFVTDAFEEIESYVKLNGKTYDTRAMYYSPATGDEGVEGELVFAGVGKEEDFEDLCVKDKIVIFHRDKETEKDQFWPEVRVAAKKGAKGVILINFDPWIFITTLETGLFDPEKRFLPVEPNPIPAVVVGRDSGKEILNEMEKGNKNIKIFTNTFNGKRESKNVRGIKLGTELPDEKIIIYGHRDAAGTPGANDNGSGTVIMMEIARLLKDMTTKRTVEIVSLGAEEQLGSVGSIEYIKKHENELHKIKASIELDMVGAGSPLWVMEGGNWPDTKIELSKDLCNHVKSAADELGYHIDLGFCVLGTPDSGRFAKAGVPTTWIWGPGDVHYHSPEDTWEKVDPNKVKAVCDIVLTSIYDLANQDEI
ncbi:M20/M25/M40 family metallo-hydrolase [Natronincola ferrireducens]|uniref:Carboxypeptidase Q n=1 Tax=Natronincola ferrireducens TaxID=393762 RepID=A0A1G8X760_9FIRM|nr:M20/M25/M40 family metallo-hydrolase [Natronincola ferrireducens]SDJ86488.1 PA domain-containing protein [Natronincola ferrireducens]